VTDVVTDLVDNECVVKVVGSFPRPCLVHIVDRFASGGWFICDADDNLNVFCLSDLQHTVFK